MGISTFAITYMAPPVVQTGTDFFQVATWNMSELPAKAVATSTENVFKQVSPAEDISFLPHLINMRARERGSDVQLFANASLMAKGGGEYQPRSASDGDAPVAETDPVKGNTASTPTGQQKGFDTLSIDEIIERLKSKDASEELMEAALNTLIDAYARRDYSNAVEMLGDEIKTAVGEGRIHKPADWWVRHFLSSKDHIAVLEHAGPSNSDIIGKLQETQPYLVAEIFWKIAEQVDSDAFVAEAFIYLVRFNSSMVIIDREDERENAEKDNKAALDIIQLFLQSSSLQPYAVVAIEAVWHKLYTDQAWDLIQFFLQSESLRPYALEVAGIVGCNMLQWLDSEQKAQLSNAFIRQLKLARAKGGLINPPSITYFKGGKYLVVITAEGDMEIRYKSRTYGFYHVDLVLSGDKIVGAGEIKTTSDGRRLAINGASGAIPTHKDHAVAGEGEDKSVLKSIERGNVSMAEQSGLKVIRQFLSELYGVEVEVIGD